MHSLKNMVVAVLLLGVSYGVYEVITTPEQTMELDENLVAPLVVTEGAEGDELNSQSANQRPHIQLPSAVSAPPTQPISNPSFNKIPRNQAADNGFAPPKSQSEQVESITRQPEMDFATGNDLGSQQVSGVEPAKSVPHDQELIDALKDHLDTGASDEDNSFAPRATSPISTTNPSPPVEMESTPRANPIPQFSPDELTPENMEISAVWTTVEQMVEQKQFKTALAALTRFYNDPSLTSTQEQKLHGWLDALAGKVIYSTEHMLAEPYTIQPNESIVDIASRWNVTPQLVYNVNKQLIPNPSNLDVNTQIKMVNGPFHAEVNTRRKVLTVFVGNLYAGRFPVQLADNAKFQPGRYGITAKSTNVQSMLKGPQPNGGTEHGPYWMGMEGGHCMHAMTHSTPDHQNCIGLSSKDAADLFSIFTEQSQIFIK